MLKSKSGLIFCLALLACEKVPPSGDPIFSRPSEEWADQAQDIDLERLIRLHIEIERYYGKDIFFEDELASRGRDGLLALLDHIEAEGSPLNSYKNYHGFEVVLIKSRLKNEYDFCLDEEVKSRIADVAEKTIRNKSEAKRHTKSLLEDC